MFTFLILLKCFVITYVFSERKGEYECGEHGRFEYCIDEIPGCVIGCHCHPGYYFDTETKICEPNLKLIEHHRRTNVVKQSPYEILEPNPTTSKIDNELNGISKDTDDLGDWLYNQFFKTIENQVINKTNDKNIITRRSNLATPVKKPKRRKKINKVRGHKRNNKKRKLKKKLLRITENDSLFDVSGSSSYSSSDSSDSSFEYSRYHDDDDIHGHKKIVMIKKKPRQPLPNFIFLPNMETPFYPPIGLPPPPVAAPMYPMVPVPPLIPFFTDDDSDEKTTAVSNQTTSKTETTRSSTTKVTTTTTATPSKKYTDSPKIPPTTPATKNDPDKENNTQNLRHSSKKRKKDKYSDSRFNNMMWPERQKFLQHLKQKMKNPTSKLFKPFHTDDNNFEKPYPDMTLREYPYLDNVIEPQQQVEAPSENVDFKYLTELIHRVDLNNKSDDLPPIEYNPLDSLEAYQPPMNQDHISEYITPPNAPDTRRFDRPKYQQPDDQSYYTNLGRQIASMIRNIDAQNKEVNIKLEASRDIPKNDLFVNMNSPRSYWERSIRSPLTFLKSNKERFEYLKRSNELLFDIENKVEIIASTTPTLTLQEIENIVKVMETAKRDMKLKLQKDSNYPKSAIKHLNINLWPRELLNTRSLMKNSVPSLSQKSFKETIIKSDTGNNNRDQKNNIASNVQSLSMLKINRLAVQQKIQAEDKSNLFVQTSEKKSKTKPISYHTSNQISHYKRPRYGQPKKNPIQSAFTQQILSKPLFEKKINPFFFNGRKYFDNNYFGVSNLQPEVSSKGVQPSYFQHQVNLLDYAIK